MRTHILYEVAVFWVVTPCSDVLPAGSKVPGTVGIVQQHYTVSQTGRMRLDL